VLNRGIRRQPIFLRAHDYRAFLAILHEGLERHPVRLVAYCLMSNHWHLVLGPIDPPGLSRLLHWVTTTHSVRWHRHRQTTGLGPVYQNRFWSEALVEPPDLVRVCRYVERNALRARLVQRAEDWPWCSLSERLQSDARLPLVSTPFLCSDMWRRYVNAPQTIEDYIDDAASFYQPVENRPVPLPVENSSDDVAEEPGGFTLIPEGAGEMSDIGLGADEDEADAHVEGPEHLGVPDLPDLGEPGEDWRHDPAFAID
jgi:putative transposase